MIGRTHGEVDTDSYWASGLLGICTLAFGIVSDNEKDSIGSARVRRADDTRQRSARALPIEFIELSQTHYGV
jgi:hypothetical protein